MNKELISKYNKWVKKLNSKQKQLIDICKDLETQNIIYGAENELVIDAVFKKPSTESGMYYNPEKALAKYEKYTKLWNNIKTDNDLKKYVKTILDDQVQAEIDSWKGKEEMEDGCIGLVQSNNNIFYKEFCKVLDSQKRVR